MPLHCPRHGGRRLTDTPAERAAESTWTRLRRRKVVQWGLVYVAAAWGFLQGLEYLSEPFHWPAQLQPDRAPRTPDRLARCLGPRLVSRRSWRATRRRHGTYNHYAVVPARWRHLLAIRAWRRDTHRCGPGGRCSSPRGCHGQVHRGAAVREHEWRRGTTSISRRDCRRSCSTCWQRSRSCGLRRAPRPSSSRARRSTCRRWHRSSTSLTCSKAACASRATRSASRRS